MPILIALAALFFGLVMVSSVTGYFTAMVQQQAAVETRMERFDMIREMGPVVRRAMDTASRFNDVCPSTGGDSAGYRLIEVSNTKLCWPQGEDGCVQSAGATTRSYWICPLRSSISNWRYLDALVSVSYAGATEKTPLNAVPGVAAGVSLRAPDCNGDPAQTACISCDQPDTTCFTMTFCVSLTKENNCGPDKQVTQSFAFRTY